MRFVILLSFLALLTSCAQKIKRQAHILPVYDGMLLYSAQHRFIDSDEDARYLSAEVKRPPRSTATRLEDGTFKITWVTSAGRPEKLIFLDSGLHPVVVPERAIRDITDLEEEIPLGKPFILTGFGPNTAYVREYLDLRPIPKDGNSRTESEEIRVRSTIHVRGGASG